MLCTSVLVLHKKVWLKQETTTTKMSTTSQSCFLIFFYIKIEIKFPPCYTLCCMWDRELKVPDTILFTLQNKENVSYMAFFITHICCEISGGGGATSANTVSYLLCRNVKVFSCSLKLHLFLCIFIKMFINLMAQAVYSWHINLTP